MAGWWTFVLITHVLGACIWVGALVTYTFFIRPKAEALLKDQEDSSKQFLEKTGRTLGFFIAGVLVPVQLFSGLALLMHRGVRVGSLSSGLYGKLIVAKIIIFFVVVAISAAHGVASTRAEKNVSQSLAYLALAGSIALAALGAALVP